MYEYVQRHKLPFFVSDVHEVTSSCKTCAECKPQFFQPKSRGKIKKAMKPFDRLGIDLVGPNEPSSNSQYCYILTNIDQFSRLPFAFPLRAITTMQSYHVSRCYLLLSERRTLFIQTAGISFFLMNLTTSVWKVKSHTRVQFHIIQKGMDRPNVITELSGKR